MIIVVADEVAKMERDESISNAIEMMKRTSINIDTFLRTRAVDLSDMIKKGNFVNLKGTFADTWIEIEREFGDLIVLCQSYKEGDLIFKHQIDMICDNIFSVLPPHQVNIIYSEKGKFGGQDGKMIGEYLKPIDAE